MKTIVFAGFLLILLGVCSSYMLSFNDYDCADYSYEIENGRHYISSKCGERLPVTNYDYWRRSKRKVK